MYNKLAGGTEHPGPPPVIDTPHKLPETTGYTIILRKHTHAYAQNLETKPATGASRKNPTEATEGRQQAADWPAPRPLYQPVA